MHYQKFATLDTVYFSAKMESVYIVSAKNPSAPAALMGCLKLYSIFKKWIPAMWMLLALLFDTHFVSSRGWLMMFWYPWSVGVLCGSSGSPLVFFVSRGAALLVHHPLRFTSSLFPSVGWALKGNDCLYLPALPPCCPCPWYFGQICNHYPVHPLPDSCL